MRKLQALLIPVLALAACATPTGHRVLTQGNGKLVILDRQNEIEWQMPWGGIHDLHVLPSGNIMVQQGAAKVVEIDRETKQVVWQYDSRSQNGNNGKPVEVHAFQPLANGRLMIAESGPARIIEVDRNGTLLSETKLKVDRPHPHTDTRLVRKITNDRYLVCHEGDGFVREYEQDTGRIVWEYDVPMFERDANGGHGPEAFGDKCFCALRLGNGNTLIATGNGHSVMEVTSAGDVAWQVTQDELEGIRLAWVTTLEVLANGNIVIGNCHAGPGQPLLVEVERDTKKVVWQLDQFDLLGNSVPNSVLLDAVQSTR
ncbi:MAG: outer membrane protein assembly factor BamB [Neolewinella sp.]|jgi:outer membrane protein assembly factor BamB